MNNSEDYVMHPVRTAKEKTLPSRGVFFVNPADFEVFRREVINGEWVRLPLFNSHLYVHTVKQFFAAGPSIGAAMAVLTLEKLIVLGAKNITFFGWGGGLGEDDQIGDIVLLQQCVCGEGVSQYYSQEKVAAVQEDALAELRKLLEGDKLRYRLGIGWSMDAPYREKKSYLAELNSQFGVDIIDMEASALNTVARFRGINLSFLLVISDLPLSKHWRMASNDKGFKHRIRHLVQLLCSSRFVQEV